jgi:hypothetical protein
MHDGAPALASADLSSLRSITTGSTIVPSVSSAPCMPAACR